MSKPPTGPQMNPPLAPNEVSASSFVEAQTKQIEREFHRSKPKPRNSAMVFYGYRQPRGQQ